MAHPAGGRPIFSGVARGGGFLCLQGFGNSGKPGLITGAPTAVIDGVVGPALNFPTAGGGDDVHFASMPITQTPMTLAAIFRIGASFANAGNYIGIRPLYLTINGNGVQLGRFGGTTSGTLLTVALSTPYFLAISTDNATIDTAVFVNLATGAISSSTTADVAPSIPANFNSTLWIGNNQNDNQEPNAKIAAAMMSNVFLSEAQLRVWASDPWSFWYPYGVAYPETDAFSEIAGRPFPPLINWTDVRNFMNSSITEY